MRSGDKPLNSQNEILLAVTMGDPAGIGPEIVAKLLCSKLAPGVGVIVIGDAGLMRRWVNALDPNKKVVEHRSFDAS